MMKTAAELLALFQERWGHPHERPEEVWPHALTAAEASLGCTLPDAYREAILTVGLPQPTLSLAHSLCELESPLSGIGDFFAPDDIVSESKDWWALSMPDNLVAFASDGCGNKFCFDRKRLVQPSAVFF